MINLDIIQFNEPIYYVPSYDRPRKVKICSIQNDTALVKPYSKKHNYSEYTIPLKFVFSSYRGAKCRYRSWAHWRKTRNDKKRLHEVMTIE